MQPCLINQSACGRVAGNPVCPKCGMDERVVYPGQADREAAQTIGLARYSEAQAKELELRVRLGEHSHARAAEESPVSESRAARGPDVSAQKSRFDLWRGIALGLLGMAYAVWALLAFPIPRAVATFFSEVKTTLALEPDMVAIPAGSFIMGSPDSEPDRDPDEGPQHKVQVAAFELGKYEVTFAQWDACVDDGGCSHLPEDGGALRGDTPVMNVSWNDITMQYLPWLNRKTGKQYRLPSEAEWEYAARAGCQTAFNVGGHCVSKIEPDQANFDGSYTYNGSAKGEYLQHRSAVGSYAANSWGLYDMHGNVWEWVQDCWNGSYGGHL